MLVTGIIAEYNPFHNGHQYHLEASREKTGADYTVVAMSGNFTQRGTPAAIHKYARAKMALLGGADLVLEIPSLYACASAEYFAHGAVALLDRLGVVDCLCFGSECGDEETLGRIAHILAKEPAAFRARLADGLKSGRSYPSARFLSLTKYCPSLKETQDLFASPNNILGTEYIRALFNRQSAIRPVTVRRVGAGYHDRELAQKYPSATAIRDALFSGKDPSFLRGFMPDASWDVLCKTLRAVRPLALDDFSQNLLYRLLEDEAGGYDAYLDVSNGLSDRIRNTLFDFRGFSDFCGKLKSRDNTHTRISRCLLHILLDIKKDDMQRGRSLDFVPYARVLGLRRSASPLLSAIKKHSDIPLITSLADAGKVLTKDALAMLRKDILISHIYNAAEALKCGGGIRNEYRTPVETISS